MAFRYSTMAFETDSLIVRIEKSVMQRLEAMEKRLEGYEHSVNQVDILAEKIEKLEKTLKDA